jgi:hypothetical protein
MLDEPPNVAFIESMDAIPLQGQAPLDLQAAMKDAAARMLNATPLPTIMTILDSGASAWCAPPPTKLEFPKDHGLHLACGPEWYWLTCTLDVVGTEGKEKIGMVICIQRERVLDPGVQARWGISDHNAQLVFSYASVIHTTPDGSHKYARRPNQVWPALVGEAVMQSDPFVFSCGPDSMSGSIDVMPLRVVIDDRCDEIVDMAIDIVCETDMPVKTAFFLQGDDGVTPPPRAGIYYSWPQLKVKGAVFVGGRTYMVEGKGWLDHELMYTPCPDGPPVPPPPVWTPPVGIYGWTFCDLNFDNGDALVAAGFQSGKMLTALPSPYGFYVTPVAGVWQKTFVAGVIQMEAFLPLTAQCMLPVSWNLAMAGTGIDFAIQATPFYDDGSFLSFNQSVQGETPCDLKLLKGGQVIAGQGYCESVGYEPPASYIARALEFLAR